MAVYEICLPQAVYRELFERCEAAGVDQETMTWLFGRKKLAFLGSSQYKSLGYGEVVRLEEKNKTATSPAHEFGSYNLGLRGRNKRRKQVIERIGGEVKVDDLLVEGEVGPWVDELGSHYKFEDASEKDESHERWTVRKPHGREVEWPNIGELISLKRGQEILECYVIDIGDRRKATATLLLKQLTPLQWAKKK